MEKMDYEYEKYVCDKDGVLAMVQKYGVAIVPNVLNEQEIVEMVDGMWTMLEYLTAKFPVPMHRDKPETYASIKYLRPIETVIFQQWSIGHADFIWQLRQNPKVVEIFAKLWNVSNEELLVSFDGASFQMPPETTKFGWYDQSPLFHTDQSLARNDFECVQAWITGFNVNEHDATLAFLEGSQKYHAEFAAKFNISYPEDWYVVSHNKRQMDFYVREKNCAPKCIKCPAGTMVFWDSRTIHFDLPSLKERQVPNFRCVAYICMLPRNMSNERELKKKQDAFNKMLSTSHWPNRIVTFPTRSMFNEAGIVVQEMPPPRVTPLGMKLAGF